MKRLRTSLLLIVFALALPAAASALNLHNGFIQVTNDTSFEARGLIQHVFLAAPVGGGYTITIPPHSTRYFNNCCIAAGSEYDITPDWIDDQVVTGATIKPGRGSMHPARVLARLCNVNGIPFGYAHVRLALVPHAGSRNGLMKVLRIDEDCPR